MGAAAALILVAALVVILVVKPWDNSTATNASEASNGMTAGGSPSGTQPLTTADKGLLMYVDPEIHASCKHYDDLSSWELAVAGVTCTPPHDADSVTYLQLKGSSGEQSEMKLHHHFYGLVPSEYNGQPPPSGNCQTASDFTALQQGPLPTEGLSIPAQLLACFHHGGKGQPELVWTTWNPYVLAWATGSNPQSLLQYWEFTLGPCHLQNATQSCNNT